MSTTSVVIVILLSGALLLTISRSISFAMRNSIVLFGIKHPGIRHAVLAALSRQYFVSNAVYQASPFEVRCPVCRKDYSRESETSSHSGMLEFFGVRWAWYEAIDCHCGRNLFFGIIHANRTCLRPWWRRRNRPAGMNRFDSLSGRMRQKVRKLSKSLNEYFKPPKICPFCGWRGENLGGHYYGVCEGNPDNYLPPESLP